MPVEIVGAFGEDHRVTLDATTEWPRVSMTCACGWHHEVEGTPDGALDAAVRIAAHTGGPTEESIRNLMKEAEAMGASEARRPADWWL